MPTPDGDTEAAERGADLAAAVAVGKSRKAHAVLRAELSALRLSDLRKRAAGAGIQPVQLDAAIDSDDAKGQLIALVLSTAPAEVPPGDSDGAALKAELAALRLTALRKRAMEAGVDSTMIDNALDGDNAKEELIALLLRAETRMRGATAASMTKARAPKVASLTAELQGLRISALQKRAEKKGVDAAKLDDALEADNAKEGLIKLIVEVECSLDKVEEVNAAAAASATAAADVAAKQNAALTAELQGLRISALQKRATADGVDSSRLDAALDADNAKEEVIKLIVGLAPSADASEADPAENGYREIEPVLRAELAECKLGALQRRAVEEGVEQVSVMDAIDEGDDPRARLIELIIAKRAEHGSCNRAHETKVAALRSELSEMRYGALQKRAIKDGVDQGLIWDAADRDDSKEQLIELIVAMCVPPVVVDDGAREHEMCVSSLRIELQKKRLGELQKKAVEEGCKACDVMDAIDSDRAKEDIIDLIIAQCLPWPPVHSPADGTENKAEAEAAAATHGHEAKMAKLREELGSLKLGKLNQRALAKGVPQQSLTDALNAEVPKEAVLELLLAATASQGKETLSREQLKDIGLSSSSEDDSEITALAKSLRSLNLGALSMRAVECNISASALSNAQDADDPKAAIIALLLEHERASKGKRVVVGKKSSRSKRRSHHGGSATHTRQAGGGRAATTGGSSSDRSSPTASNPTRLSPAVRVPNKKGGRRMFRNGKHAMISYQWDEQKKVVRARNQLAETGVPCWMDSAYRLSLLYIVARTCGLNSASCLTFC